LRNSGRALRLFDAAKGDREGVAGCPGYHIIPDLPWLSRNVAKGLEFTKGLVIVTAQE
jgi:hypothetical protein